MKTAIELADEFPEQNLANIEPDAANLLNGWGIEAVAMLLHQADQIEALKADAERLDLLESTFFAKRWNGVIDSGSQTTWHIVPGYQHSMHRMVGHTFRAAIDAMKGKS